MTAIAEHKATRPIAQRLRFLRGRHAPRRRACSAVRLTCTCVAASVLVLICGSVIAAEPVRNVLVLYGAGRLLQANIEADRGLRLALRSSPERPIAVFDEFLDVPRFGGPDYPRIVATYLREKYASNPPDVIVAGSDDAFAFLLRHRAQFFPGKPLVHEGVPAWFLRSMAPLPADVIGVPVEYDFAATMDQALHWHPQARHVVLVTGAAAQDRAWEARLRSEALQFEARASIEFLAGLPDDAVLKRLGELGPDSVVFTPGYWQDGDGRNFTPRSSVAAIAVASKAPVYGPYSTFIGTGAVGGFMTDFEAMGRQAGETVNALLDRAAPASLALPPTMPMALKVDWRQVRRWGIAEAEIPGDAVVQFREDSLWRAHRGELTAAALVFLIQAALIAALVFERRRRRLAELATNRHRAEFAHASRLAVAGELTASIAHEINQPLGAILANADTAELLLEFGADKRDDLRRIVADIRRDDLRAGEIIRRLRTLLSKQQVEHRAFDLNDAVRDMESLLRPEVKRRGMALELRLAPSVLALVGDRIQIQQVLINLVLNAMDAMTAMSEPRRTVVVATQGSAGRIGITVRDRGKGIAAEDLPKIFDSFFSTKRTGMGLGLSIARTVVEAHGGHIRPESSAGEGAAFHVELPMASSANVAASGLR